MVTPRLSPALLIPTLSALHGGLKRLAASAASARLPRSHWNAHREEEEVTQKAARKRRARTEAAGAARVLHRGPTTIGGMELRSPCGARLLGICSCCIAQGCCCVGILNWLFWRPLYLPREDLLRAEGQGGVATVDALSNASRV